MEFGLDQLRTDMRPGSSSRAIRWSKPNSITLWWSQTGPRLVADMSQTC